MKKRLLILLTTIAIQNIDAVSLPILQKWQQRFSTLNIPFPSLQEIKQHFKNWGSYEYRMWRCARGTVTCSPQEIRESALWIAKRIVPIYIALLSFRIYRFHQQNEQYREWERLEREREEGLKREKERRERGETYPLFLTLTKEQQDTLEDFYDHDISPVNFLAQGIFWWYSILDVPKDASKKDIIQQYHRLSLKFHPDKPGGNTELFTVITQAYNAGLQENKKPTQQESPLALPY